MRKTIVIFIVSAVSVGLLVAGCGGGDEADAQRIDKATFVRRANAICKRASGRLAAEIGLISSRGSASYAKTQIVLVRQAMIPRLDEELQDIEALGIPGDAKRDAQAFLEAYQKAVEKTKASVKAVSEGFFPFEPVELAGTKFGVSQCPIAPAPAS